MKKLVVSIIAFLAFAGYLPAPPVILTWDPPVPTDRVVMWNVFRRSNTNAATEFTSIGTTTTNMIVFAPPPGAHYFTATAVNIQNLESDMSDPYFYLPLNKPGRPGSIRETNTLHIGSSFAPKGK